MELNWIEITTIDHLNQVDEESKTKAVLIFKHSTSCGISSMALNRLETKWKPEYINQVTPYFLNLLAYRNISNEIARRYSLLHESPQVLIISNGKCFYDESHSGIRMDEILQSLKSAS